MTSTVSSSLTTILDFQQYLLQKSGHLPLDLSSASPRTDENWNTPDPVTIGRQHHDGVQNRFPACAFFLFSADHSKGNLKR
jgi:hypothetical protein